MNSHYYAVIMAGGSGTRLWPMSRKASPKQFQKLVGDNTLIQETYKRLAQFLPDKQIYIATLTEHAKTVQEQLPKIPKDQIIIEPALRNTGPAIALVAATIMSRDKDAIVATVASDHYIINKKEFASIFETAYKVADKNPRKLVTVGINPDKPDTSLGYIEMDEELTDVDGRKVFSVSKFVEKPDEKTAQKYMKSWRYLWNAAYYFFRTEDVLNWIGKDRKKVVSGVMEIAKIRASENPDEKKVAKIFESFPNEQFEYAVIEKLDNIIVVPAELGWSDVGTWSALHDVLTSQNGTHTISRGKNIDLGSQDSLIYAKDKLIATIGLKDIVIVDTDDVLFVANKKNAHDVKKVLEEIKKEDSKYL